MLIRGEGHKRVDNANVFTFKLWSGDGVRRITASLLQASRLMTPTGIRMVGIRLNNARILFVMNATALASRVPCCGASERRLDGGLVRPCH